MGLKYLSKEFNKEIDLVYSYCWVCHDTRKRKIILDQNGMISSNCSDCEASVSIDIVVKHILRQDELFCPKCGLDTIQIKFLSSRDFIHWFCCSCGRDFMKTE
jgi:hypothetical protein